MTPIITARGLVKRYGQRTVVRGVDLDIPARCCFGVLGPNGAGKTTTLRMLLGQSPMDDGALDVFGLPIRTHGRAIRARTGVVPQTDNLDPDFTVVENLRIYARYFGIDGASLDERIPALLEFAGLTDRADAGINTLSGGMKRRLTIARALVNDPELVVLDEPTTGLDPQARHMIWGRLRALRASGKTLLLTTHYMEEAERLCDELVVMDDGRILERGTPAALIRRHVEPDVLELQGEADTARAALAPLPHGRFEAVGDTYYYYTHDVRAAIERLDGQSAISFLHRPANLEDVFLKLTGRDLRD